MNIGIDVDGVLADLISAALRNSRLSDFTKKDVTEWDFFQKHGYSKREQREIFFQVWNWWQDNELSLEYKYPDKLLKKLMKKHRISIITHRDSNTHCSVVSWLNNYNIPYHDLLFVGDGLSKFEFPIDCLIDDSPKTVEEAKNYPNKKLYLVNQSWNKNIIDLPNNVLRVNDLGDAINRVIIK